MKGRCTARWLSLFSSAELACGQFKIRDVSINAEFNKSVFTWRHSGHIGVPNQPCGSWTLFSDANSFFCSNKFCIDAGHVSENTLQMRPPNKFRVSSEITEIPRDGEEPLKIEGEKSDRLKTLFISELLNKVFIKEEKCNKYFFTWGRSHSHHEKDANQKSTTNLHLYRLIFIFCNKNVIKGIQSVS